MEMILKQIEQADEVLLNQVIIAVINRYDALTSDREGWFLSLSTDPQIRKQEMEGIINLIRQM